MRPMDAPIEHASAWIVIAAGLAAGAVHAATGPDHLAGVAPMVVGSADASGRTGARAWRVGAAWGLGHAVGAIAGALVVLALRSVVPGVEQALSRVSEHVVGLLLCVVGALGVQAALRTRVHEIRHAHDGVEHVHAHWSGRATRHRHAAFVLGTLHGLAGLSHLFATLPALALPGRALPALYLSGYALASLAVLTVFASVIGRATRAAGPARLRTSLLAASAASIAVGVAWIAMPH